MRWRAQHGQGSGEYLGGLLVVSVLIAVLATTPVGASIRTQLDVVVCRIANAPCEVLPPTADVDPAAVARAASDLQDLLGERPSPDAVATFFEGLDPAVAAALALERPELVGNLDGAPFALRFAANAEAIRRAGRHDLLEGGRRFLVFDPSGDGRIAEVFGEIETARHVAIVVPGMDNELSNYSGENARRLYQEANVLGAGGVATIQWLGYDTPEGLSGAFGGAADDGAESLVPFLGGTDAQRAEELHVTVVGHSYGSLVPGKALRNEGLQVDDAVAVGSPGMGVNDADDLGDGYERLWAARANGDIVGSAPFHGEDPHDVGFGATRFHTGDICAAEDSGTAAKPRPKPSALQTAEASVRAELRRAATVIGRRAPRFERAAPAPCESATGPTGEVTGGLRATLTAPSSQDRSALVVTVTRHWRDAGWTVRRTALPAAFATRQDGTTLALKALPDGSLELSGGTPCVRA